MHRNTILACSVLWFALLVLLAGCGGLEKGPAPVLPYTPEPPRPRPEPATKADIPKKLGPSLKVPIKLEPPDKKDEAPKKEEAVKEPVKDDEKNAPAEKKDAPPAAKKDEGQPKSK